ncbi:MAG: CoA transferase [Nocardioides sp.]
MSTPEQDGLRLLADVAVVDFTQALSGPYCTLILADLGADVVKVEPPGRGDDSRHWGPPFVGDDAAYFMSVNRNKRSVTLDLKDPPDLARAHALVAGADVVVENWRPGTAARLGLGADELRERHPRLVICSISGFGQDQGPRSGYDQIVQGTSGVMSLTGPPGEPTKWGVPVGDISAGMFAAHAILAALYDRKTSGTGRTIDVAMQDSLVAMLTHHAARYLSSGVPPVSDHNLHATIAPYGMFRAADGFLNVCVGNDSQFERMGQALDRPDLATDERFATNAARLRHRAVLLDEIEAALAGVTVTEATAALDRVGVPAGRVRDVAEVLDDPATEARRMLLTVDRPGASPARVVNTPWKIDGHTPTVRISPPTLGEHTADVLGELARVART